MLLCCYWAILALSSLIPLKLRLDCAENQRVCVFLLFFFFLRVFQMCSYCLCTVQWTITANFDFSNFFHPISAHRVLFTGPQISLFSNFFIKNGFHGTIHTFKNYFATVFFSFQFQFSVFSCIQTDPNFLFLFLPFAN